MLQSAAIATASSDHKGRACVATCQGLSPPACDSARSARLEPPRHVRTPRMHPPPPTCSSAGRSAAHARPPAGSGSAGAADTPARAGAPSSGCSHPPATRSRAPAWRRSRHTVCQNVSAPKLVACEVPQYHPPHARLRTRLARRGVAAQGRDKRTLHLKPVELSRGTVAWAAAAFRRFAGGASPAAGATWSPAPAAASQASSPAGPAGPASGSSSSAPSSSVAVAHAGGEVGRQRARSEGVCPSLLGADSGQARGATSKLNDTSFGHHGIGAPSH